VKSGFITDSYSANTVFFDGAKWWTPNTPLLAGTQRSRLLGEEKIFECTISPEDISKYTLVGLINAMWDLEELKPIPVKNIVL
jgi:4-amino-4-deoxychorismate lyase